LNIVIDKLNQLLEDVVTCTSI